LVATSNGNAVGPAELLRMRCAATAPSWLLAPNDPLGSGMMSVVVVAADSQRRLTPDENCGVHHPCR